MLSEVKAPILWTLHDCWSFTGGCHYPYECQKYMNNCGCCPQLGSKFDNDLSRWVYNRKAGIYKKLSGKITLVVLSKWLAECVVKSSLQGNFNIEIIPNCINTDVFKPVDKEFARNVLNLPKDRKIILFGAMSAMSDERKGFQFLMPALNTLAKSMQNIELMIFGASKPEKEFLFPFPAHYFGRLYDDISLVLLYAAADLVIVPSMQDNLPNVVMEALSCATPVVAFNTGGITDMVEHMKNGYLAEPYKVEDLANGIKWILEEDSRYKLLSSSAREKVMENYAPEVIAKKHLNLYKRVKGE